MREKGYGERRWFSVQAKAGDSAEVFIYDEIGAGYCGGGVEPSALIKEVNGLKLSPSDTLNVRINSPGGSYFDGNTIYNYLRGIKSKIRVIVDGMAASAASIIAMAGDTIEMPSNAMMVIHNPWSQVAGDARSMRKAADDLDKMQVGAVATYLRKAGDKLTEAKLVEMLDAETYLTADDAVKWGLADVVSDPVRASSLLLHDIRAFGLTPPPHILTALARKKLEELRRV
jgi:ATP-dependent Clp protease protease subunit